MNSRELSLQWRVSEYNGACGSPAEGLLFARTSRSMKESSEQMEHVARTVESQAGTIQYTLQSDCLPGCRGSDGALHVSGHHPRCPHYDSSAPFYRPVNPK